MAIGEESHDVFNFQRSMSIDAINRETKALDRKAHFFWKIPAIKPESTILWTLFQTAGMQKENLL